MFAIVGILVVFGAVVGGYLMEKGNLLVLMQPAELLIIAGAATGTVLIANPPRVLAAIVKGIVGAFTGSRYTKERHLDSLKLLYEFFDHARRAGLASLESEVEDYSKSKTFAKHPAILKDHHACAFIADTFRTTMISGMEPWDVDNMLETDIDVHHHVGTEQVSALTTVADSLPGLGIVAAVLGVVITMGSLGGRPEEIGHKVASALVGTFLGILLCYGLIGPLASSMAKALEAEKAYYQMLRITLSAFTKGIPPLLAVEAGRRSIPTPVRPSFNEVEKTCRNRNPEAQPQPEAA